MKSTLYILATIAASYAFWNAPASKPLSGSERAVCMVAVAICWPVVVAYKAGEEMAATRK